MKILLAQTGLRAGASWLLAEASDAAHLARSIPLSKALDDAIIAFGQNGEAVRPQQGYPVRGDGHNLPPGSGTAKEGEELYVTHCAACHGDFGEGLERWPALMGGRGSLRSDQPRRSIGSFWQHAPSVFDYIRRAMPYAAPQTLSNDEYYAITAYVLFLNELIGEDDKMDSTSLPKLAMPNRDGFVLEGRPDTENNACMSNCRQGRPVSVTMDSRRFVAPGSGSGTDKPE